MNSAYLQHNLRNKLYKSTFYNTNCGLVVSFRTSLFYIAVVRVLEKRSDYNIPWLKWAVEQARPTARLSIVLFRVNFDFLHNPHVL